MASTAQLSVARCSSKAISSQQVVAPRRLLAAARPARKHLVCRSKVAEVEASNNNKAGEWLWQGCVPAMRVVTASWEREGGQGRPSQLPHGAPVPEWLASSLLICREEGQARGRGRGVGERRG